MDIARSGQLCAVARAAALADLAPVAVRSDRGWTAVRSRAVSNDLNVVVSEPGYLPRRELVEDLTAWFDPLPASWLVARPDAALTGILGGAGWRPERTGRWCGGGLETAPPPTGSAAVRAVTRDDLADWLEVAGACGWYEDAADREARRELLDASVGDDRRSAWVARSEGLAVGMASGWCDGVRVEVVDVAVREEARRLGTGRALVSGVLAWGAARGAREVVAQPSPDGWRLFGALGLRNVPVVPDVCFYGPNP